MLLEFRVANFKSYAEEQVFSFVADNDQTLLENTIECPQSPTGRVIRLAVLYGPNGGGKSGLVVALHAVRRLVVDSARWQEGDPILMVEPFKLDGTLSRRPSRFEVTFVADWHDPEDDTRVRPIRYQYGFAADGSRVHEEWLLAYPHGQPQTWFERTPGGIEFGRLFRGEKKRIEGATRTNALFLSVAAQHNHPQILPVFRWLRAHLRVVGVSLAREVGEPTAWRQPLASDETTRLFEDLDPEGRASLLGFLRSADLGIEDVRVERQAFDADALPSSLPLEVRQMLAERRGHSVDVRTVHRDRSGNPVEWSLAQESEGTQNFYCLLGPWFQAVNADQTIFFDELFSNLHPILARQLVHAYAGMADAIGGRSQVLVTTHDTNLLDSKHLRRDQIWFVEKNPDGASRLYSLLEYRPRKDEAFERGYLAGRYGALPFIGEMQF